MENDALALRQQAPPSASRRRAPARWPCMQAGAPGQAATRRRGSSASTMNPSFARSNATIDAAPRGSRPTIKKRPPGREPEAGRAERPRALDQRLEPNGLDFAEGRRRADDDRRAEDVRARGCRATTARRCERARGFASQPASAKTASAPVALDQRAHPPRRRFAGAGEGEERPAEPRRDIAGLAGRALRGQRVVAGEKHRERPVARRLEADVRVDVAERQAPLRVEDEAEFRRQPAQALVLR